MNDAAREALTEAVEAMNERLETELRGAWRAGYDYVHVYSEGPEPLAQQSFDEVLTLTRYVLPTDAERPPEPDGYTYEYTFDIGAVPDDVIREAIEQGAGIGHDARD